MRLAVFDFDGTMIRGDSVVSYLVFAAKEGLLPVSRLISAGLCACLHRLGLMSAQKAKSAALSFRGKVPQDRLTALDRAFAEALLSRIRPDALDAVKDHRQRGDTVVLLTASTDHYMRFVAEGLPADRLICSETDRAGQVLRNVRGEEKVKALQEFLDSQPEQAEFPGSCAYGDSASDLPLLRLFTRLGGQAYLVCPGWKARKKAAGQFQILTWR